MVPHEHVGMNSQRVLLLTSGKEAQIVLPVVIVEEFGAPIDTPLGDMNWDAGDLETGLARHDRFAWAVRRVW